MRKFLGFFIVFVICFGLLMPASAAAIEPGVSVKTYGALGDGITNDTFAIQKALSQNENVFIPEGTYMIDPTKSLVLQSNQTLVLSPSAILAAIPCDYSFTSVIKIAKVKNVTVTGGHIIGEGASHSGAIGEWGHGIFIADGASDVTVKDIVTSDCWGDGVYIGCGQNIVKNVTLENVISYGNRRQGLSITNAEDVLINNCIFSDSYNKRPGIDLEPCDNCTVKDITINNTKCINNSGCGIQLMGCNEAVSDITISDSYFNNNGKDGMYIENSQNVKVSNSEFSENGFGIEINKNSYNLVFQGVQIFNNSNFGLAISARTPNMGSENLEFIDVCFYDNGQTIQGKHDGVKIYSTTGYIKNISFTQCEFYDDQSTKTQRFGLYVDTSGKTLAVSCVQCSFNGNVSGDYRGKIKFLY
jgi:parallel beta-helix repeat protein